MSLNTTVRAGAVAAAFAMFAAPVTADAANSNAATLHQRHHVRHAIYRSRTVYRRPMVAYGEPLPPAPEYGFLTHVPPNAMRMPGYTFVPGKGIIGESCDLPTSACSNQYRDVQ
jgi:hypothetical protein